MGSTPRQQLQCVAQDIHYRVYGLHGTPRGSRDVEDEATTDGSSHPAGQASERAHGAHGLGQARGLALDDGAGRLRREVGRRESRPSSGYDESREPSRQFNESGRDRGHPVGYDAPIDDVKPVLDEDAGEFVAGSVLAVAHTC